MTELNYLLKCFKVDYFSPYFKGSQGKTEKKQFTYKFTIQRRINTANISEYTFPKMYT